MIYSVANETKERPNGIGKYFKFKSYNNAEKLLTRIIIFAVIALAFVMAYHVFQLHIFPTWKIAITIFILILPVCLFLQAFLNVEAVKDERFSKFQDGFRKSYARYVKQHNPKILKDEDIADEDSFRTLIRARSSLLMDDGQLYSIYRQAYQLYLAYKNRRIRIKGNPDLNEVKYWLLRFELDELLKIIIARQMREDGTDFPSYLLPLSFFLFMYFSGFLVVTSFVDAIFNPINHVTKYIPLFPDQGIPIIVVQWGFMGGLVYTSISLLNRFLRNDLVPRVYFNAAFRLILSAVVAIIIYFIYMIVNPSGEASKTTPAQILLLCFLAGVAPIQFLIHFADTQLSKLNEGWKRRSTPGNRPITQLEGIDSVTSQRLSEEGISYIHEMALCNHIELSSKTNYPLELVYNWKDQAILQTLTGGIVINKSDNNPVDGKSKSVGKEFLSDALDDKLGIRTISSFIDMWNSITSKKENGINEQKMFLTSIFDFADKGEEKFIQTKYMFDNIVKQGKAMINNRIAVYPIDEVSTQSDVQKAGLINPDTDTKPQQPDTSK
jgi:hypothetical protein